jgi:anti-sigma-K factor RskA
MMAYSEDHIALAAEYALGSLDANERAQVEQMMAADPDYAAMVEAWERKLGPLNQMVGSVEPPAEVWERIKAATGLSGHQQTFALPGATVAPVADEAPAEVAPPVSVAPTASSELSPESQRLVYFARRTYVWRGLALASTAIAASLLAIVAVQVNRPDSLPAMLRPPVRTQVVQVPAPPAPLPAQYVAVLQGDVGSPAFILTVDSASKNFTVRRVGAQSEPGRSYELWLVSDKLQRPRSLGVIGSNDFTRAALSAYDSETVNQATYAVTVEPEGGSPTGVATGPIVFTGKLIEAVPPTAPPR